MAILDNDHRLYADNRRTQVDMRIAKIFRFGKTRLDVGVDGENLLNTNYATTYDGTYQYSIGNTATGGTWNNPTAIYPPRYTRELHRELLRCERHYNLPVRREGDRDRARSHHTC